MVEGARLESVCAGNRTEGSNPFLSAKYLFFSFTEAIKPYHSINHVPYTSGEQFNDTECDVSTVEPVGAQVAEANADDCSDEYPAP